MRDVDKAVRALPQTYPGLDKLNPVVVYLMGCMKFDQFCCTWRALVNPAQFCPFCPSELARRQRKPREHLGRMLFLENEFPRTDARMGLIVPDFHVTDERELSDEDVLNGRRIEMLCREKYGFSSGATVKRFGDPRDHAGTIEHVHTNLIHPTREGGMSAPFAKKVEGAYGHLADYARLHTFVKDIDERGGVAWLFSPEGILETQPPVMTS